MEQGEQGKDSDVPSMTGQEVKSGKGNKVSKLTKLAHIILFRLLLGKSNNSRVATKASAKGESVSSVLR